MSISTIGQNASILNVQNERNLNLESKPASEITDTTDNAKSQPRQIDFRNISLNEVNELIKSGVEGLLEVAPFVSPDIIEKHGSGYAANIKVDFLAQIESSITFGKSIGEDTSFAEKVLADILKINGSDFPSKIDTVA